MTLNAKSNYPGRRTCVSKVRSDAEPDTFAGRLENPVTGKQDYTSGQELIEWITCGLERSGQERSREAKSK